MREVAERKGATVGQVALAWVLAQGGDVAPIPGTKRVRYLEENVGAVDVTLDPAEVEELAQAVRPEDVAGQRYPDMSSIDT